VEPKIHIVTDSTAYLPAQYLEDNPHIHVVPLTVNCGGEIMEDWVENNERFKEALDRLSKQDAIPTTSQPAPGKFAEQFCPLIEQGCEIIAITISSKFSGTIQSALNAASLVGEDKVSVVDSCSSVAGLRMLVEDAAAAALEGRSRQEIVTMLENKKHRFEVLLVPSSLEHLRRGGRIGGAQALVGSLLNIRPVLYIRDDGIIDVLEKVRTHKKALMRMIQEMPEGSTRVSVGNIYAEDAMGSLRKLAEDKLGVEVTVQEVGPVIASHVGLEVVGLFFEVPEAEDK
jgi:DegV family protein with EDD domain